MQRTLRDGLDYFARGALMGAADIIPGVSGGTIALIVGVYERLIDAISHLSTLGLRLVRFDLKGARQARAAVDWKLILPLAAGIATAIVTASQFLPFLLDTYPHQMRGLFFGLVAASIVVPWLRIGRFTLRLFLVALAAAALAFFFVGLPMMATSTQPSLPRVFASASVAICAMILPGISGAFLLEVLGIYAATTEALKNAEVVYVLVFCAGAAIGLGFFSKVLDWLLERHHDLTMAALIGLMAGSLRALWPWQPWEIQRRTLLWPSAGDPVMSVVLLAGLGFVAVSLLVWWGARARRVHDPSSIA